MGPRSKGNSGRRECSLILSGAEALKISLFQQVQTALLSNEDAGETVVKRLRRQLNKHCIRFKNSMETKSRRVETAETRVRRTKLGNRTQLTERDEPERRQPRTIQPKPIVMGVGLATSAWPKQASKNFQTNPEQPRPLRCRHTTMYKCL